MKCSSCEEDSFRMTRGRWLAIRGPKPSSFSDVSLAAKGVGAQGMKGRGKDARRLADFVFKMAECSMADDYAIFKKEYKPVCFANFEGKVVFPPPVCQEEAVFLQLNGLQHHYRIRQWSLCPFHAEKLSKKPASDLLEQKKAVRQWCSQCICYTLVACWSTTEAKKPVVISFYLQLVCEISTEIDCTGKEPYIVTPEPCLTMFWKEGNI